MDSLSEDWVSQHNSSPPSLTSGSRLRTANGASGSAKIRPSTSKSRIPHLTQNRADNSINGKYLRPRSSQGAGRINTSPVLAEHTPSELNVAAQQGSAKISGSQKPTTASTLARRPSSVFSGSIQSIQHHTILDKPLFGGENNEVPEWKRRLARGEDVAGDGCDLFGPSRLEGVFKQPTSSRDGQPSLPSTLVDQQKPWSLPASTNSGVPAFDQYQSMRASRSRPLGMDILEEVEEDEHAEDGSAIHGRPKPSASSQGIVRDRITSIERGGVREGRISPMSGSMRPMSDGIIDARVRTVSRQEELKNEVISPVTISKQNTIRDRALRESLDVSVEALQAKLSNLGVDELERPGSSSSDQNVHYGYDKDGFLVENEVTTGELTSLSLPDDLSMGTQDFISHGGYVNKRRGGFSDEASFQRKVLSSSAHSFRQISTIRPSTAKTRNTPPPVMIDTPSPGRLVGKRSIPLETPSHTGTQVPVASTSPTKSPGSPLKLFGNRDTYTNNKLLRVLSHFEDECVGVDCANDGKGAAVPDPDQQLRMSLFGKGDLDRYGFQQDVKRRPLTPVPQESNGDPIFPLLTVQNRPSANETKESCKSRSLPKVRRNVPASAQCSQQERTKVEAYASLLKRDPNSPLKDRTPKRRRTLLKKEIELEVAMHHTEAHSASIAESSRLAGTKRKDARYDECDHVADPNVLATRQMLRPRTISRQASGTITKNFEDTVELETNRQGASSAVERNLREAVADELASFADVLVPTANDNRKASLATRDYMEEATKIMQLIRAKGKPKSSRAGDEEPAERSALDSDAILDLTLDGDSTGDRFSRPPSRDGSRDIRPDRRQVRHDPRVVSHLRKFQDEDDLSLLMNTSLLGAVQQPDNAVAEQAARVPIPDDDPHSSPPNIRISDNVDPRRKRKYSDPTAGGPQPPQTDVATQSSSGASSQRTIPTSSTGSSGRKGVIEPGKVQIPDQVGPMTFDHASKTWVRAKPRATASTPNGRRARQTTSEDDPFEDIQDLSIDELREAKRNAESQGSAAAPRVPSPVLAESVSVGDDQDPSTASPQTRDRADVHEDGSDTDRQASVRSALSAHEERVLHGRVSQVPNAPEGTSKQPRAVTIAFSSPLTSAVAYREEPSLSKLDAEVAEHGNNKEIVVECRNVGTLAMQDSLGSIETTPAKARSILRPGKHRSWGPKQVIRRPVSRIEEHDEDVSDAEMSMVPPDTHANTTPRPFHSNSVVAAPRTTIKGSSIICLTPLSDFSVHQDDEAVHAEFSYVAQRTHPTSLRQAHGSHHLAIDALVHALTDAEPEEPYWEHLRRLNLTAKDLTSLHRLGEYCSALEELRIRDNRLEQLNGVPSSIRILDVQNNHLSNLTSWSHLHNLQYLELSGNKLESLDGLECLTHLRNLDANNNLIRNIDGVLDLDGLQWLRLRGNQLVSVDFEGTELTRLSHLDLSANQLASVSNLHCLPALESVDFGQNELASFEVVQGTTLAQLRCLDVSDNRLQVIDLSPFPSLQSLHLDRNNVQSIENLSEACHLDTLSVREQRDSPTILQQVLSTPNDCREIFLSSNPVPDGRVRSPVLPLHSLQYLEIASCGISSLSHDLGARIPNCRVLNLNFNAINFVGQLRGMIRLKKLLVASNRLTRLRRNCLALARFTELTEVDLRNNPLTVGFHSPSIAGVGGGVVDDSELVAPNLKETYVLPIGDKAADDKWLKLLDEGTKLKRRTIELLLAERCGNLVKLDGLPFVHEEVQSGDWLSHRLVEVGVLRKPLLRMDQGGSTGLRDTRPVTTETNTEGMQA